MKRFIRLVLSVLPVVSFAQNNPIFYGGASDGWGKAGYEQASIATMYSGNSGDGWNNASYVQGADATFSHGGQGDGWNKLNYLQGGNVLTFGGGAGDGWSLKSYIQGGNALAFTGGTGDGWMNAGYIQVNQEGTFFGGNGDGWHNGGYSQAYVDYAYRGGAGDGWASTYIPVTPLPITFLKFEAVKENRMSHINWLLAQDKDVQSFDVERSIDAVSFEKIGNVKQDIARNNTYDFIDEQPMTGSNYYRLKIVNKNGSEEYTATRVVKFDDMVTGVVKIYPNPANEMVNIELPGNFQANENTVVNVYAVNGTMIYQEKIVGTGKALITINTSSYAAGSYYVRVMSGSKQATGKFVVVKR